MSDVDEEVFLLKEGAEVKQKRQNPGICSLSNLFAIGFISTVVFLATTFDSMQPRTGGRFKIWNYKDTSSKNKTNATSLDQCDKATLKAQSMNITYPEKYHFNFTEEDIKHFNSGPESHHATSKSVISDNQAVILVWWPPSYLATALERNFVGVCGNCRLTTNRSLLGRATAILFDNVPARYNLKDLPPTRRSDQAYVLWNRETPAKIYHLRDLMSGTYDHMFNYTMSFHSHSDFVWSLGNFRFAQLSLPKKYRANPQEFIDEVIALKSKMAIWVVSNCDHTPGAVARKKYADNLVALGLDIDLYGGCYKQRLGFEEFKIRLKYYKFYLAFENSLHCKDYVTEKFWSNGLKSNTVPIVWGPTKEDLQAIAPPNSYIHTEDFKSPQDLVNYLNYLDKNEEEYRKYFEWRKIPIRNDMPKQMIRTGYRAAICKMCRQIQDNHGVLPVRVVSSAKNWILKLCPFCSTF